MATAIPANPTAQTIQQLLPKFADPDPDFRFMALNDLLTVLNVGKGDILYHDYNTASRTVDAVVKALDDRNGEVQNQAIKCLGPLVKKLPMSSINPMMERLAALTLKDSVDQAVPALALKAVVEAFPRPVPGVATDGNVQEAYMTISRVLIPRLLHRSATGSAGGLLQGAQELSTDSVDVLIEVVSCFGPMLSPVEVEALQDGLVMLLEQDKGSSAVKKRSVVAISMLARFLSDDLLTTFIARATAALGKSSVSPVTQRLYIMILGSMARSIPHRFGKHIPTLIPFIVGALSEEGLQFHLEQISDGADVGLEFNEVREAALVALEAFLSSCPTQMRPFTDEAIKSSLRYLKFDPNYAVDEDDDEDMEESEEEEEEEDDEFEADGGFDDDDDASWKVRRCAAKVLHTIISTRSSGDLLESGVLYRQVAPALVKRFSEREENVRLEVITAVALLIRKTGEGIIPEFSLDNPPNDYLSQAPPSRKRRRQSSAGGASLEMAMTGDISGAGLSSPTLEKLPTAGPRADLATLTPNIIKAATKLLKGKFIPTKQATISLLDDVVAVQRGGLNLYFEQILQSVIDAVKPSNAPTASSSLTAAGNASATPATLRIAALRLISDIAKFHSSSVLQAYLSSIVAAVIKVVHDRYYKISGQAIQTAEELVKAITPPRSRLTAQKYKSELQKLCDVIIDRTIANDADAEVRQKAIHALGTLLSRTSGGDGAVLISEDKSKAALGYLLERMKNETTRLAAVRAVDTIAAMSPGDHFDPAWIRQVVIELADQLRKANRALRGSSVMALKHVVLSPATKGSLDNQSTQSIINALIPIISNNDAQLLGPGLLVLAHLVKESPQHVVTGPFITSLCGLLKTSVAGAVLDSLLILVTNFGQSGHGQPLMVSLLKDVGVSGDPTVVGKVIGTLLVASGSSAGVTLDNFVDEMKANSKDSVRASLALAVLGEAGLRLGKNFPLPPKLFVEQFQNDYDRVSLSAAVALGRAGAGNIEVYVPVILQELRKKKAPQYFLLQSIKEVLQQAALFAADISQYSSVIWDELLAAADAEDNKAVCAECVGRMVIIDPNTYMLKLDTLLRDKSVTLRAIAVQALRYTLPDENEAFDTMLKNYLIDMLKTMLEDKEMDIRRHAMSTLNAAVHNRPELILGHLSRLIPYVMHEAVIKSELIREVQMGPFKHIIDDGLEVRKAAYETLYALMETALTKISIIDLYDRIIAGLKDDNDIRALCNLMVTKLVYIDPEETTRRLDSIAEAFRATLSNKLKDTAVKQEHEKQAEANKSVLRVTLLLGDRLKSALNTSGGAVASGSNQVWTSYWMWVIKDFGAEISAIHDENKESA